MFLFISSSHNVLITTIYILYFFLFWTVKSKNKDVEIV